jgi:septum formation protein
MTSLQLILASKSASRRQLMENAGLVFDCIDSELDEETIKDTFLTAGNQDLSDVAMILAQAKATVVSEQYPGSLVIGADQVLICGDRLYNKPADHEQAREHLLSLSAHTHVLETAVCVAQNGNVLWSHREAPQLTMRKLSPAFIGRYMAAVGDDVLTTVGGYKLEGRGIQLFDKIEGSYFAILGLPLLALLSFLRSKGIVE